MVEKKRRERMNDSISTLKHLIADTIKQHVSWTHIQGLKKANNEKWDGPLLPNF